MLNRDGERRPIRTTADWHDRRDHVLAHFQRATGLLPSPTRRVPLNAKVIEQVRIGTLLRRKLTYQSDPDDRVAAYLFLPSTPQSALPTQHSPVGLPAVLCLQQTTAVGKDEPAGVRGDPSLKYALELAERGHNGLFTAVFDERIKALVTSCGFTSLERDDIPSWTGPRYMPRLASEFKNDPKLVPFDFHELVACLAPRAVFVSAATRDDDFDVAGVREVLAAAGTIYRLRGAEDKVQVHFPDAPHSFPESARRQAYEFLDRQLAR